MKKTLLTTATLLALGLAGSVSAHQNHGCVDDVCTVQTLFAATEAGSATAGGSIAAPRMGSWGIDTAGMDTSAKPGDDYFAYVNGNWAKNTPIPSDKSSFGAFLALRDLSEARVHQQLEGYAVGNPATDGDGAKIAALYRGFLDEAAAEKAGAEPLKPMLASIRAAKDKSAIAALMGASNAGFGATLFGVGVSDDQRDPEHYTLYMGQSGLGLGDRQMYLDEKFAPQRERYVAYIAQMLTLADWDKPADAAAKIMAMETEVAKGHWTRAESRDRDKTYNRLTRAELAAQAPQVDWNVLFDAAGVGQAESVVLRQSTAIPALAKVFAATDLDTLKAWLAFHTTDDAAGLLSKNFVDAEYEFRAKFLSGQPEPKPRWKNAVGYSEGIMGEAIGRDFVKLYFPADAKAKMDALVSNVKVAMGARLDTLAWMSPATKTEAHAKLKGFGLKIGHPEQWRDYSALEVRNGDIVGNALRARAFEWDYRRARLGKTVDKNEWGMTPQTVNAYYNSVKNEIVFPAAILQPPFFDPSADPAVNYGGIGGVIGHEIIHGFDDQGRKSDGAGVLRDWWTADDAAKFEVQAAKLGAQYEAFDFPQLPGMKINARVAMGENIGDLGGLTIALEAYRRSLDGKPAAVIDGFSGEQRFFMGWAQVWRTLWREDALRQQLVNGTHSPGHIRAFAPLRNIDAWYEAFNVKAGDTHYVAPEDRVRIW